MTWYENRNYLKMINNINDDFASNGWADGYADMPSDEENIILTLYNKVSYCDLLKYVNEYLQGYEIGCNMSERALEIYDEDGCIIDGYTEDSCLTYYDIARKKINNLLVDKKISPLSKGYNELYKNNNLLELLLLDNNPIEAIRKNLKDLLTLIPEINNIIGFDHKHPHHHLDVWEHTLLALSMSECDFNIRGALLFHDIGKPASCVDGSIRHYPYHASISYDITTNILKRLGYETSTIYKIGKLIKYHDSPISDIHIKEDWDFCYNLYKVQKCDALAHHPKKLRKRINYLKTIREKLNIKDEVLEEEEKRLICKH